MSLFLGSMLFLFEPTPVLCVVKSSVHNLALCLLFASLLIQSMYLRAQKTIGLGGSVSQLNQLLTLAFIVATQVSALRHPLPSSLLLPSCTSALASDQRCPERSSLVIDVGRME